LGFQVDGVLVGEGGGFGALEGDGGCEHGPVGGVLDGGYGAGTVVVVVFYGGYGVEVVEGGVAAEGEPAGYVLNSIFSILVLDRAIWGFWSCGIL
jgi:hypothetical protein